MKKKFWRVVLSLAVAAVLLLGVVLLNKIMPADRYASSLGVKNTAVKASLDEAIILKVSAGFKMSVTDEMMELNDMVFGVGFGKYILVLESNLNPLRHLDAGASYRPDRVIVYYKGYELQDVSSASAGLSKKGFALFEIPENAKAAGLRVTSYRVGDFSELDEGDNLISPALLFSEAEGDYIKIISTTALASKDRLEIMSEGVFVFTSRLPKGSAGAPIFAVTKKGNLELVGVARDPNFGVEINDVLEIVLRDLGINLMEESR